MQSDIEKTKEFIRNFRRVLGIFGSLGTMVSGIYLIIDDIEDFGKFDHDGKFLEQRKDLIGLIREFSHHWLWGLLLFILGLLSLLITVADLIWELQTQQEPQEPYTS